jgi:hypothetical protein
VTNRVLIKFFVTIFLLNIGDFHTTDMQTYLRNHFEIHTYQTEQLNPGYNLLLNIYSCHYLTYFFISLLKPRAIYSSIKALHFFHPQLQRMATISFMVILHLPATCFFMYLRIVNFSIKQLKIFSHRRKPLDKWPLHQ